MTGTLSTWYAGQPVVIYQNETHDISTWYAGQPYVMYEYYQTSSEDTVDIFGFASNTGIQTDIFGMI